ncbi:MAG TPA: hypothetical protein VFD01_17030 [Candidatus Dormibacteraeota bacterium]|nr:hypothetical protein [Candidatus Dormibacteraeota bacterium]
MAAWATDAFIALGSVFVGGALNALTSVLGDARKYRRAERASLFTRIEDLEQRLARREENIEDLEQRLSVREGLLGVMADEPLAELRGLLRARFPELREQLGGEPTPEHDPRRWKDRR